jgi:hypothetical protein
MSVLLLPTVIVGFSIAMREFKRSQDIPILDLVWEIEPGKYDKSIKLDNGLNINQAARPVVVNNGKAVAVWYVVHFDIPLTLLNDLGITTPDLIVTRWLGHVGDQSNWRQDVLGDCLRIVFMSNGTTGSYPYYPLVLGMFHLSALKVERETHWYEVPYTIITNEGQSKNVVPLSITLRAPSNSGHASQPSDES